MTVRGPKRCERCGSYELHQKLLEDGKGYHVYAMTCEVCWFEHQEWIEYHHAADDVRFREPEESTTVWATRVVACGFVPAVVSLLLTLEITLGTFSTYAAVIAGSRIG